MAGFNKEKTRKRSFPKRLPRTGAVLRPLFYALVTLVMALVFPSSVGSEEPVKVAVLPFQINTAQKLPNLREELQALFQNQLKGLGFQMTDLQTIREHPLAEKAVADSAVALSLGKELAMDFVVVGSLTQVGQKISLDVKALDVSGLQAPISIFAVEENMEQLKAAVTRAVKDLSNGISGLERVDSLKIKGNKRVETEAIMAVVGSRPGEVLDQEQLDKDLKSIYAMGFFKDVSMDLENGPQGKIVIFNVVEKPSIGSITFRGNKKIKQDDLRKETGIKLYAILNQGEVKQAVNRLKEFYRQKGFYKVQITEIIEERSGNEVALVFAINEESKVYIERIEFSGNAHFRRGRLLGEMQTKEKGFFSFLTQSGLHDKKKLETDVQRLLLFYHNNGYIRAKIGEPRVSYDEKEKGLKIVIEIDEGLQYLINEVKIEGDTLFSMEDFSEKVKTKKGKPFSREILQSDIRALKELYTNEGYAYAEVAPEVVENDEKKQVDIVYHIDRAQKVRLERINITGNSFTRDKVVRRELRLNEGEYFSGKNYRKSRLNLYNTTFFEEADLETKKGSADDLMIMDVKVKEKQTGSIFFGGGYSGYEKTMGKVQIEERNLFGKGLDLSASMQLSSRTSQYDIKFTNPWLFDKPLRAGIDLYKLKEEYDEFTKDGWGSALRFGFPIEAIDEETFGSIRYGYDNSDIVIASGSTMVVAQSIRDMEGNHITSSITLGISRDTKDHPFFPMHGSINSISYEYAGGFLGGDVAYDKWNLKSTWYFPVSEQTAFMAQGRWGYIHQRPDDGILPPYQKFRLGGINSVRGFKTNSISPRDPVTGNRIGGEKMMVYNLEYRFPLYKRQGITGVLFFDAGNVYTADESYSFSSLKKSYGAGIRWLSPIFPYPIRLEYGKIINPINDESDGGWEFAINMPF